MLYQHLIRNNYPNYEALFDKAKISLSNLRQSSKHDPLLSTPFINDDIKEINEIARNIRDNFKSLIILATGGSSLNGQIFTELSDHKIDIKYLDNIDPITIDNILKNINIKETAILCISKSGSTSETLAQLLVFVDFYNRNSSGNIGKSFFIITQEQQNPVREIAQQIGATILEHLPVGGRFSTFTNVALLPAAIAGINIEEIRHGASILLNTDNDAAAEGASLCFAAMESGHNINVIMPYIDQLTSLVNWHCQIWAESLGKSPLATTPIRASGTFDQHSQLQLYLGGPKDKLFTFITRDNLTNAGPKITLADNITKIEGTEFLLNKTIGDLISAHQSSTIESLINNQSPVRNIIVKNIDATTLGALAMHFMLETLIFGHMANIDPFGQPAVEQGKIRTKELMSKI